MAVPLEARTINRIGEFEQSEAVPVLVHLGHWDLYPSVFLLQQDGVSAIALDIESRFDIKQHRYSMILASRSYLVVCAARFSTCVPDVGFALVQRGVTRFNVTALEMIQEGPDRVLQILKVARA